MSEPIQVTPANVSGVHEVDQYSNMYRTQRPQLDQVIADGPEGHGQSLFAHLNPPFDEYVAQWEATLVPEDHLTDAVAGGQVAADGFLFTFSFAEQAGEMVLRSLRIEPKGTVTPAGGITANFLRRIHPARWAQAAVVAQAQATDHPHTVRAQALRRARERLEQRTPREPVQARRAGRPGLTDDFLAEVAIAYLEETIRGRGALRRVGQRMTDRVGYEPQFQTVRDWVRKAREREFLGPAPKQGKRGAEPGPRLYDLLDQSEGGNQ